MVTSSCGDVSRNHYDTTRRSKIPKGPQLPYTIDPKPDLLALTQPRNQQTLTANTQP